MTDPPAAVQIEALRLAAVGHEDGAVPGAGEVPTAPIARESRWLDLQRMPRASHDLIYSLRCQLATSPPPLA